MNRSIAGSIFLLLVACGCADARCRGAQPRSSSATPETMVVHVVVCWLKAPGNVQQRDALIDASRGFKGRIPGLLNVTAGAVLPSTRPAADSSYDVAIVMTFRDEEALISYGKSVAHQQAVRDVLKPLVQRYTAYDFTADTRRP